MIPCLTLLAQVQRSEKLEEIAQGFQYDNRRTLELPGVQWFLVAFGLLFVLMLLIAWRTHRNAGQSPHVSPARFFAKALREIGLSFVDRALLRWIARRRALDQPIVLLFSPALLDQQASSCIDRLSAAPLRRYARQRLDVVMGQVFVEQ
ncbi:MAG TPA: hypothetical protein VJZ71_09195 [Phycisphaerae bacterium]|nr:hypothetical protein [Phycisphaerae bacterium]